MIPQDYLATVQPVKEIIVPKQMIPIDAFDIHVIVVVISVMLSIVVISIVAVILYIYMQKQISQLRGTVERSVSSVQEVKQVIRSDLTEEDWQKLTRRIGEWKRDNGEDHPSHY